MKELRLELNIFCFSESQEETALNGQIICYDFYQLKIRVTTFCIYFRLLLPQLLKIIFFSFNFHPDLNDLQEEKLSLCLSFDLMIFF
jgi:hypothetical protein